MKNNILIKSYISEKELFIRKNFFKLFKNCPIPDNELISNLPLFLNRIDLSDILFIDEIYKKITDINGIIMEFGVRWGKNLALLEALRGIYEPFNYKRKIIGFDTFNGFPSIHKKDGSSDIISKGAYSVTKHYEDYLKKVLDYQEEESPIIHIKKYELIKGNVITELPNFLKQNPETIIAFAYFDLDIYKPTVQCLKIIRKYLTKGSVIGFDELNMHDYPGETLALKEVFGLDKYKIRHSLYSPVKSYIIVE